MAVEHRRVSAGDYVVEPPDLWTSRLPRERWGERIPQVARQADGTQRWVFGGEVREPGCLVRAGALADERFDDPQTWEQVPEAAHSPAARLAAMDRDGVDVQVLYPGAAGHGAEAFASLEDPELEAACCAAYNDWLIETWGRQPRFVPQCVLPIASVEAARAELERSAGRGHRGAVMHPFPWHVRPDVPHVHDKAWDPLWAAIQAAEIPLCWPAGAGSRFMLDVYPGFEPPLRNAFESARRPISNAIAVASFLLGGIAERFPRLKVVFTSSSIDWIVFQLENSDWEWHQSQLHKENVPLPSEVFHRQCFVTTWFERAGFAQREVIGIENILWQSEFPLSTSTYPDSAESIERNLQALSAEERERVLYRNAAALYGIEA